MTIRTSSIRFPVEDGELSAFLALPETGSPTPGVVVVPEIFGLNDDIREHCTALAERGYAALAPDFTSRPGGFLRFCFTDLFRSFVRNDVGQRPVRDLHYALTYLQQTEGVDRARVGAMGFCLGGGYVLLLACVSEHVRAAVAFYGRNPKPLEALGNVRCPLLYMFGEDDRFIRRGIPALEATLRRHGIAHEVRSYPGASHAFMNAHRSSFRPQAAADAWPRVMAFFDEHLGPASA